MFGLPGGAEWLVIIAVIALLFVPGVIVFGAGYLAGKRAGQRASQAEDVSAADRETMADLAAPVDEPLPKADEGGESTDG